MLDAVLAPLEHLMTSWWIYPALFGLCTLDAFVPVFPSEAPLILAGVYAASDPNGPQLVLIVLVATLGAALGDHLSYGIGRVVGARSLGAHGSRRTRTFEKVSRVLHERGSWALLVVRFIPGGRSVGTMSLGAARYPLLRQFTPYDLLATLLWALHGCLIGYIGGRAFGDDHLAGILTGMGLATAVAALLEGVRHARTKRRMTRESHAASGDSTRDAASSVEVSQS